MHDELTQVDIRKMQEEIDYRTHELRPKLIEDLQTARAFGDLSPAVKCQGGIEREKEKKRYRK